MCLLFQDVAFYSETRNGSSFMVWRQGETVQTMDDMQFVSEKQMILVFMYSTLKKGLCRKII